MNRLSSQQRKLAYLAGILLLLIPIIALGMPADGRDGSGGVIARLRQELDLGESDLGELDPSGAAMNLVLLGLRGVAANVLWVQAEEQKNMKKWAEMRSTTESITRLQPHYVKVWDYNGWNLAYNVAAEWDAVPDRYFWVKEGGKFMKKGVERNRNSPDLHWYLGNIYGKKIGVADEVRFYRRYFREDPDPKFGGKVDPEWNDRDEDHYLVAKDWFLRANDAETRQRQTIQDRSIFRSYPARSQLDYAAALQKFGFSEEYDRETKGEQLADAQIDALQDRIREKLRDQTREAWAAGLQEWTQQYGGEIFKLDYLGEMVTFRMEMGDGDYKDFAKTPEAEEYLRRAVTQYQNMTNYRYWRTRALCEAEPETAEAHWQFFAASEEYRKQNFDKVRTFALKAMELFEQVLTKYPSLKDEDTFVEEGLTAVLLWQFAYRLDGEKPPEDFPFKGIWEEKQSLVPEIQRQLERRYQP
jgi:hypothetical protein